MKYARYRGKYFEEFNVGDEFYTPGKTITEADVVSFAQVTGDWHPNHIDAEWAKTRKATSGQRVAHHLLSVSIISGLMSMQGIFEGTIEAYTDIAWSFHMRVLIGDTISGKAVISEKKEIEGSNAGRLVVDLFVYNQRDELVSQGKKTYRILRKS